MALGNFAESCRCRTFTNGFDYEGDDVAGTENVEVEGWRYGRVLATESVDQTVERNITGGEEIGAARSRIEQYSSTSTKLKGDVCTDNKTRKLHLKQYSGIWTFGSSNSSRPSEYFPAEKLVMLN